MKLVISLGGSLIIPEHVDYKLLMKLKKLFLKLAKKHKIVIVTGGGDTARSYFRDLKNIKLDHKEISLIGIAATKLNARTLSSIFNIKDKIPDTQKAVIKALKKKNIVICGALGYKPNMTSDGNAAELAARLKANYFINLTNVSGLYNKNPKKFKNAKFIPRISFNDFNKIINKIHYKPGQNFVLDQTAAKVIKKHKIKTVIISGRNIKNLNNFFSNKKFKATIIS